MPDELIFKTWNDVKKAGDLLRHSIDRYTVFDSGKELEPDALEFYDALAFRFEKCVEITLSFFKTLELNLYGKSSETLRDRLLIMQKLNLINNPEAWIEARLLRNKIAHTYESDDLTELYNEIHEMSSILFHAISALEDYLNKIKK